MYVASSPEIADVTGKFFVKGRPVTPSAAAQDDTAAARLWDVSADLTGLSTPA